MPSSSSAIDLRERLVAAVVDLDARFDLLGARLGNRLAGLGGPRARSPQPSGTIGGGSSEARAAGRRTVVPHVRLAGISRERARAGSPPSRAGSATSHHQDLAEALRPGPARRPSVRAFERDRGWGGGGGGLPCSGGQRRRLSGATPSLGASTGEIVVRTAPSRARLIASATEVDLDRGATARWRPGAMPRDASFWPSPSRQRRGRCRCRPARIPSSASSGTSGIPSVAALRPPPAPRSPSACRRSVKRTRMSSSAPRARPRPADRSAPSGGRARRRPDRARAEQIAFVPRRRSERPRRVGQPASMSAPPSRRLRRKADVVDDPFAIKLADRRHRVEIGQTRSSITCRNVRTPSNRRRMRFTSSGMSASRSASSR